MVIRFFLNNFWTIIPDLQTSYRASYMDLVFTALSEGYILIYASPVRFTSVHNSCPSWVPVLLQGLSLSPSACGW